MKRIDPVYQSAAAIDGRGRPRYFPAMPGSVSPIDPVERRRQSIVRQLRRIAERVERAPRTRIADLLLRLPIVDLESGQSAQCSAHRRGIAVDAIASAWSPRTVARKFSDLRAKMSPDAQARARRRTLDMLVRLRNAELRRVVARERKAAKRDDGPPQASRAQTEE
ncbi:MAG TPA: hypothetical protein VFD92_26920 [Candidatus Binatia bacterium]|nr:hypothetical protein [Candidatus Binatia bacterium]